jgi:hypothetical protein
MRLLAIPGDLGEVEIGPVFLAGEVESLAGIVEDGDGFIFDFLDC